MTVQSIRWYGGATEALQAFERRADVVTGLSWPRFPPHASTVPIALGNEALTMLGIRRW